SPPRPWAVSTLPTSGAYVLTAHGLGGLTGSYAFSLIQTPQADLGLGSTYNGTLAGSGEAQLFRITVPAAQVLSLQLSDPTSSDRTELYAQLGSPPTRATYDYRFASPGNNQSLVIPN